MRWGERAVIYLELSSWVKSWQRGPGTPLSIIITTNTVMGSHRERERESYGTREGEREKMREREMDEEIESEAETESVKGMER